MSGFAQKIDIIKELRFDLYFIRDVTAMRNDRRFKIGSCSILIGDRWLTAPFLPKPGKLLRISKPIKRHNDEPFLSTIRTIPEYSKYYAIPDEETFTMTEKDPWWQEFREKWGKMNAIKTLFTPESIIVCQYIPDAGELDVLDALNTFSERGDRSVWNSYASVWRMTQQIARALRFLHERHLCHLDIKAENVMVSNNCKEFRLIDFGFCSKEPFADFINDPRGTPGYFPRQFGAVTDPGLPLIYANDMEFINGRLPMQINPKLVYSIEAFCFGRLINYVFHTYHYRSTTSCLWRERGGYRRKLQTLLQEVLEADVHNRITICRAFEAGLL